MSAILHSVAGATHLSAVAVSAFALFATFGASAADKSADSVKTETPIKHVIVVIGENRSFDHVFGNHVPNPSQSILRRRPCQAASLNGRKNSRTTARGACLLWLNAKRGRTLRAAP